MDGQLYAAARDVTDRVERERLEREQEAEHLELAKLESIGTLAGGIAHDFNNFLAGILGNISLAKMHGGLDGSVYGLLEEAERASLRAKELAGQLLTFSQGGAPVKKWVALGPLVEGAATFAVRGSAVRVAVETSEDLGVVEVDEGQIAQVVHNLVKNAGEAMPAGGTVHVSVRRTIVEEGDARSLDPGSHVELVIRDSGVGIAKDHLARVFEPYFTTKQTGSGLGLATTHSIVKRHGGVITVESEPGVGTTVSVLLPAPRQVPPPAQTDQTVSSGLRGHGRILVMDDEAAIRTLVRRALESWGFSVVATAHGAEAIERYQEARASEQPFAAVILDLTIPGGMGGEETIARLREIDPGVKALVSSGYATDPIMAEYRSHGFAGVVVKPYAMGEMRRALSDLGLMDEPGSSM